jgi:GNAT superfamily N-acetyltransferase
MNIVYLDSLDGITAEMLKGFFVGWPQPPSPGAHLKLLCNSDEIVIARDEERGRVVGFITAITDHVLSAYLPLLEVLPGYRRRGIGGELLRRMLTKLDGLYMIDLVCDVELNPLYERFGLKAANAMVRRDYRRQAGRS